MLWLVLPPRWSKPEGAAQWPFKERNKKYLIPEGQRLERINSIVIHLNGTTWFESFELWAWSRNKLSSCLKAPRTPPYVESNLTCQLGLMLVLLPLCRPRPSLSLVEAVISSPESIWPYPSFQVNARDLLLCCFQFGWNKPFMCGRSKSTPLSMFVIIFHFLHYSSITELSHSAVNEPKKKKKFAFTPAGFPPPCGWTSYVTCAMLWHLNLWRSESHPNILQGADRLNWLTAHFFFFFFFLLTQAWVVFLLWKSAVALILKSQWEPRPESLTR